MSRRRPEPDANEPERGPIARAWYEMVRLGTLLTCLMRGGIRITGRANIPARGGALIVSNHLSFLDVFALGLGIRRPLRYVARSSLFVPMLAPLIRSVGGFPIEREGAGVSGLKETLRHLRAGQLVLIFPEGTRSKTGELGPLKPGIAALLRAGVPIIPAAVAGTFEAWPPGRKLPAPHPIRVHFGPPLAPDELAEAGADPAALLDLIRDRILACQREARAGLARDLARPQPSSLAPPPADPHDVRPEIAVGGSPPIE